MNDLIKINGVRGRLDVNGAPELNLEDVARGLGFTQKKGGVEYIRWETIRGYIKGFGFSQQVGKDDYIPENIFYKLCFKASNHTAQAFQNLVTDEVLPEIRKHGAYLTPAKIEEVLLDPDVVINMAMQIKEERQRRKELECKLEEQRPKVQFADSVEAADDSMLIGNLAKLLTQNGFTIGQNRLFSLLRTDGYLCSRKGAQWNIPTQKSMELGLFEVEESIYTSPSGVTYPRLTTKVTGYGQIYFINKFCSRKAL